MHFYFRSITVRSTSPGLHKLNFVSRDIISESEWEIVVYSNMSNFQLYHGEISYIRWDNNDNDNNMFISKAHKYYSSYIDNTNRKQHDIMT